MDQSVELEKRALGFSKWANLFMAISGVTVAYISRAEAFLIDGLYSFVNFVSVFIAAYIGEIVVRKPSPQHPFGYETSESLYVTFRSLVLLGILGFAAISSTGKIVSFVNGVEIMPIHAGPIVYYIFLMVGICFTLAYIDHIYWIRTNRRSDILKSERQAAFIDGVMSLCTGLAFLALPLLERTSLAFLLPIADSIIVLVMVALMFTTPLKTFLAALGQVSGKSAGESFVKRAETITRKVIDEQQFNFLNVKVIKMGRVWSIVPYLKPLVAIEVSQVDELKNQLISEFENSFGMVRSEIVLTAQEPYGK